MMKKIVYIERGCRQQGLTRSPYCNNFKVTHGRLAAIELFEKHLLSSHTLLDQFWTLSGCRLVCHCRPEQECNGDVIIRQLALRYASAYDRNNSQSAAPKTDVLEYMAGLRETPDSYDGSTADEDALPRGSGWVGRGLPRWLARVAVCENTATAKHWCPLEDGR